MKPRYEVRLHSFDMLGCAVGLPATERILRTTAYRWRWLASLSCWFWNIAPSVGGIKLWATLHRQKWPTLTVVDRFTPAMQSAADALDAFASKCPPAPLPTSRLSGKGHSESAGAGGSL